MTTFKGLIWAVVVLAPIGPRMSLAFVAVKGVIGSSAAGDFDVGDWFLAKTGTRGGAKNAVRSQLLTQLAVASGRSFGTEREGLRKPLPTPRRKTRKIPALQQVPHVAAYGQNIQKSDKTFKKS